MNNTLTTVIIDDQPECIETLEKDLNTFDGLRVAATASTADSAWKAIIKQQPDLLFLDVELADESGLELLNDIRPAIHKDMHVVFYSAFDKYMLDALRASAFDFLLKPYQYEELAAIIERAKEKTKAAAREPAPTVWQSPNERKFAMQTITGLLILRKSDILYQTSGSIFAHTSYRGEYTRTDVPVLYLFSLVCGEAWRENKRKRIQSRHYLVNLSFQCIRISGPRFHQYGRNRIRLQPVLYFIRKQLCYGPQRGFVEQFGTLYRQGLQLLHQTAGVGNAGTIQQGRSLVWKFCLCFQGSFRQKGKRPFRSYQQVGDDVERVVVFDKG